MNNLAFEQLFELGILIATAAVYIMLHFACSGLAILISGQKSGVIRGFLQGTMLVTLLAMAEIFFFNGKIKVYHIFTYFFVVFAFMKSILFLQRKIKCAHDNKKEKVASAKNNG